jgi:hypothetical protein
MVLCGYQQDPGQNSELNSRKHCYSTQKRLTLCLFAKWLSKSLIIEYEGQKPLTPKLAIKRNPATDQYISHRHTHQSKIHLNITLTCFFGFLTGRF